MDIIKVIDLLGEKNQDFDSYDNSIYGSLGTILFQIGYFNLKRKSIDRYLISFSKTFEKHYLYNNSNETYSSGFLSFGLIYRYLFNFRFIERDLEFESMIHHVCVISGNALLKSKNYDFMHGATGIVYYLLEEDNLDEESIQFLNNYLQSLYDNRIITEKGIAWEDTYQKSKGIDKKINLGLAHGMPSILKTLFLLKKKKPNLKKEITTLMFDELLKFIIDSKNKNPNCLSSYSNFRSLNDPAEDSSRLSWCYGDLGIGYVLYEISTFMNNFELKDYSIKLLLDTTKRTLDSGITEANLCHGSSGLVYIYEKLWRMTGLIQFKNASSYWINQTMSYLKYDSHGNIYFKSNISENNSSGLLEGDSGIGIVMICLLTGSNVLDEYLML